VWAQPKGELRKLREMWWVHKRGCAWAFTGVDLPAERMCPREGRVQHVLKGAGSGGKMLRAGSQRPDPSPVLAETCKVKIVWRFLISPLHLEGSEMGDGRQEIRGAGADLLGVANCEAHSQRHHQSAPFPPVTLGYPEVSQMHELSLSTSYAKGFFGEARLSEACGSGR
jgi:hypothetical protein